MPQFLARSLTSDANSRLYSAMILGQIISLKLRWLKVPRVSKRYARIPNRWSNISLSKIVLGRLRAKAQASWNQGSGDALGSETKGARRTRATF